MPSMSGTPIASQWGRSGSVSVSVPVETDHERVVECIDADSGSHAIIALHSTKRGPAVGGTRVLPYLSREEALADVLRLSRAMSYKAALAGVGFGGGKAVIIGD